MHWFSESGYFELVLLFLKTRNYKEVVNVWPIFGQGQSLLLVMLDSRSVHWFGNIVFSRKGSLKWFWHHKIQETINRGVVVLWFILLHKSTFSKQTKSNFTIYMPPKCYFLCATVSWHYHPMLNSYVGVALMRCLSCQNKYVTLTEKLHIRHFVLCTL